MKVCDFFKLVIGSAPCESELNGLEDWMFEIAVK